MELIYVWVENYNDIIIDQEFYFTNEYTIEKDISTGTIDIQCKNTKYNIFENNKDSIVKNIFGIIGENGVGKSSVLNIILSHLFKGFSVYKLNINKNDKKYLVIYSNNLIISESELYRKEEYNYEVTIEDKYNEHLYEDTNKLYLSVSEELPHLVYFDNIFNPYTQYKKISRSIYNQKGKDEYVEEMGVNISTNYEFFKKNNGDSLKYASNEIKNTLLFFSKKIGNIENIKYPNKVYFTVKKQNFFGYVENFEENYKYFKRIFNKNIIYIFIKKYGIKKDYNDFNKITKYFENNEISKIIEFANNKKVNVTKSDLNKYLNIIKEFKNMELESLSSIRKSEIERPYLEIGINEHTISIVSKFLSIVKENSINEHFFDYSFNIDYSSGERGLLTLFTRLYAKYEEIKDSGQKDVLLLLDEPDILYHPEWQRKFIYSLKNFLEQVYKNKKVKVIVTSHSPFIASDLPKENVIMLEKDKDGKCIVKDNKIDTFGANIFDLYSKAFFVKSSFGEFAKEKIQDIAQKIEEKKYQENKEEIDFIVNSIGEPLIKNKLLNMIKENQSKEDRISELEQELKRLRGEN